MPHLSALLRRALATLRHLFAIRRGERLPALLFLVAIGTLQALLIAHYNGIFMDPSPGYWARFLHHFHLSGYDPITYSVATVWTAKYNVYRHPLLAFFVAPLCWVNNGLMALTGVNCVQYVVALVWSLAALYAFLFARRILAEVIGLSACPATILAVLLFSFAHVMVAAIAPDHFLLSLMLLLLGFYVGGTRLRQGRPLGIGATLLLFLTTAGVTLSNGVKVFVMALFVNGRRFFRPRYLLLAVVVPSALLWTVARTEYHYLVLPQEKAKHALKKAQDERRRQQAARQKAQADSTLCWQLAAATQAGDTALAATTAARLDSLRAAKPRPRRNPNGKPLGQGEFLRWTDITTSRTAAITENLLGESIILHRDHLLDDVLRNRPVVVPYRTRVPYILYSLLAALALAGMIVGWRDRFLQALVACVGFDMLLHLGLGFGLNEVYIMACHWVFLLHFAIGYLLKALAPSPSAGRIVTVARRTLTVVLALVALGLLVYNATLTGQYLLAPLGT